MTVSVTKKRLFSALLVSVGIVLGYLESIFLPFVPLYGLKIGLSNFVIIYAVYELKLSDTVFIGVIKAVLCGVLFSGLMSIAYSLVGILLSVFSMNMAKKIPLLSEIGVSVLGSSMFQIGQIIVACLVLTSFAPMYYLAYLLIGSVPCGMVLGVVIRVFRKKYALKGFKNE